MVVKLVNSSGRACPSCLLAYLLLATIEANCVPNLLLFTFHLGQPIEDLAGRCLDNVPQPNLTLYN